METKNKTIGLVSRECNRLCNTEYYPDGNYSSMLDTGFGSVMVSKISSKVWVINPIELSEKTRYVDFLIKTLKRQLRHE